ncbi:MAG: hypothetical protein ACR2PA_07910 [Hyphomicrobiaceae bacterium]
MTAKLAGFCRRISPISVLFMLWASQAVALDQGHPDGDLRQQGSQQLVQVPRPNGDGGNAGPAPRTQPQTPSPGVEPDAPRGGACPYQGGDDLQLLV